MISASPPAVAATSNTQREWPLLQGNLLMTGRGGGAGGSGNTFGWDKGATGEFVTPRNQVGAHAASAAPLGSPHGSPSASPTTPSASSASSASTPFFRPLSVSDLYTLGVLGRGSSGVVYKSFYAPTVELLAVKAISIVEKDKRKQLTAELRTLTLQPHAHTIGFRGAYFDEEHIYIALEYMDGGSLDDLVTQHGPLSEIEIAYIFEQVLRGLRHLQKMQVIHRDIKPHNILYNRSGCFKLTDFGIIADMKDRSDAAAMAEAKTFVGTLLYMSPERIGGAPYSYSCDVWSMALSMITCRVGKFAIPHSSHWELINAIQSGPAILNAYSSDQISDTLRDLLSHCLRTNPAERPTAAECLRHPFFSHFRINGAAMPIPLPPGFPPVSTGEGADSAAAGGDEGDGQRSERSERRARKAAEVEQRNERHMLEQVCKLMVHKGMTCRPSTGTATAAAAAPSFDAPVAPSPRLPAGMARAPLDPKLCDRICNRLSSLLRVPTAHVREVLVQTHNAFVGLA